MRATSFGGAPLLSKICQAISCYCAAVIQLDHLPELLAAVLACSVPSLYIYKQWPHLPCCSWTRCVERCTSVCYKLTCYMMMLFAFRFAKGTQQTSLHDTTVSSSHGHGGLQKHRCRPCVKNRLTYMQNFCVDLQSSFCTEFLFVFRTYHTCVCAQIEVPACAIRLTVITILLQKQQQHT